MPIPIFFNLLEKIKPIIGRQDTKLRKAISSGAHLEATLRTALGSRGIPSAQSFRRPATLYTVH